ncbi:MAG: CRISPR-associated endonuclease Cas9 [Chloroflexi bacterium]|nr:CRISPR-associated endonuclease Cas9 [Chloroflexota bacterium]
MSKVFVLDTNRKPLNPCHPAKARRLLTEGKAAVLRRYPFTIILKREVENPILKPLRLKIDPGSKITGLAIVNDVTGEVEFAAEIQHRGQQIKKALDSRRSLRRGRRNRKLRYRAPRFLNRKRREGWLPPSLESRVDNVMTWVNRLSRVCPITAISQELVRFDTQMMQNPEINGVEYQQGELAGYEVREYLLEKFGRKCVYCGQDSISLEIEHIVPRIKGGSNRVSNLTLACSSCNSAKGSLTAMEFGYPEIQKMAKMPLRDAASVNSARWALFGQLKDTGLELEVGTGGRTKFNRVTRGLAKSHWADAACVGASTPEALHVENIYPLLIKAMGHGKRQRCRTDRYGFTNRHAPRAKRFMGFQTGDIVKAIVPMGNNTGVHVGRIAIRFRPSFRLNEIDVHPKYLIPIHQSDGYDYAERRCRNSPVA